MGRYDNTGKRYIVKKLARRNKEMIEKHYETDEMRKNDNKIKEIFEKGNKAEEMRKSHNKSWEMIGRGNKIKETIKNNNRSWETTIDYGWDREMIKNGRKIWKMVNKESDLLRQLKSPFIIELYWARKSDFFLYLIMEYAEGGDLLKYVFKYNKKLGILEKRENFSENAVRVIAAEIIVALEDIHDKGYIHGDIKLGNIVIGSDGHVKLIDLQFANKIGECPAKLSGTSDYMAPELFKRSWSLENPGSFKWPPSCKENDYFALGVILYMMLTGKCAFPDAMDRYKHCRDNTCWYRRETELQHLCELRSEARDIISKFLVEDVGERRKNIDNDALKNHPFFEGIRWDYIKARRYPSPFKPIRRPLDK